MKDVYDKIYTQVFANFFRQKRKEHKLTRREVSEKLNINQNTYACYEYGTRDCPLSVLKKLCSIYNIDFYETFRLLDEESENRKIQYAKEQKG